MQAACNYRNKIFQCSFDDLEIVLLRFMGLKADGFCVSSGRVCGSALLTTYLMGPLILPVILISEKGTIVSCSY